MSNTPPAGPANINGVVYQMLWSLLRSVEITVLETDLNEDGSTATRATFIMEPRGGGGDLQELRPGYRVVQQVKSGKRAWSLRAIVTQVFPDLYKAVDLTEPNNKYKLITEGWMGEWKEVASFFASLRDRPPPDSDVLASLDNSTCIRFRRRSHVRDKFWANENYTARSLFERIDLSLSGDNPSLSKRPDSMDGRRRKLWHLLGRFEIVSRLDAVDLQRKIDAYLLEMIDNRDRLSEKRDAMLFDLARRASTVGKPIVAKEFLSEHGCAVPLSHWDAHVRKSATSMRRKLSIYGYNAADDVRDRDLPGDWPAQTPLLGVTGESGQGKSWRLYHLANTLTDTDLVVLIESTNNAESDLTNAATQISNIFEWDGVTRIERVTDRLRAIDAPHMKLWMYLLIDGIQDASAARALALQDWETWGVVLILAGHPNAISEFKRAARMRAVIYETPDFTDQQVCRYLFNGDLGKYYSIPDDTRELLGRPLMARLYREIMGDATHRPESEYELYDEYWQDIFLRGNVEDLLAEAPLHRLAMSALDSGVYNWSTVQIEQELSAAQLLFVRRKGLLFITPDGRMRFWHDRILNWAVSQALITAWKDKTLDSKDLVSHVTVVFREPFTARARTLRYVLMDVVWQLAHLGANAHDALSQIFSEIERIDPFGGRGFYSELLPTIGVTAASEIAPVVIQRIYDRAALDPWTEITPLSEFLALCEPSSTIPLCLSLLSDSRYAVLEAACQFFCKRISSRALEPLWTLLQDINSDRDKYQKPGTSMSTRYWLKKSCIAALTACAAEDPDWVVDVILSRDVDRDSLTALADILPTLPDASPRADRCHVRLQEQLDWQYSRFIAEMAYRYPDPSSIAPLQRLVQQDSANAGANALRALTRVDTHAAVNALQDLSEEQLCDCGHWCLLPLLMREPEATNERFAEMLRASADPLRLLDAFQGFEHELSADHVDIALDALEQRLTVTDNISQIDESDIWPPLQRICSANSVTALNCLKGRRASRLEHQLTEWLLGRPPRVSIFEDILSKLGLELLYRIGGDGFTKAVNTWLQSGVDFAVADAIAVAHKRPGKVTLQCLRELAKPSTPEPVKWESCYSAVIALARAKEWKLLTEAIVRCGTQIRPDVLYARSGDVSLPDDVLAPAIGALLDVDSPYHPGAILAVAMGQMDGYEACIVDVLEKSDPGSELETACLVALSQLLTKDDRTLKAIVSRRMQTKVDGDVIANALANNTSGASSALLTGDLSHAWNTYKAITLLNRNVAPGDMVKVIKIRLRQLLSSNGMRPMLSRELSWIVKNTNDKERAAQIMSDDIGEALRDEAFAPEGGLWFVGIKATVIQALALVDPDAAYSAALHALKFVQSNDRNHYPALLVELDPPRAVNDLFPQVQIEASQVVVRAIGHALRSIDVHQTLSAWANDTDDNRRVAACLIAKYQEPAPALVALLTSLLADANANVAEEAVDALLALKANMRQTELLTTWLNSSDTADRWALLDTAIAVGDIGDNFFSLYNEFTAAFQACSQPVKQYLREKVGERRKELFTRDEKLDKERKY